MIRALLLVGAAAVAGAVGLHGDVAPARVERVSIPFEYEDARLYVPVEVGGQVRSFILDTGAQATIFDDELAASLGMRGRDTSTTTGAGAGSMRQARGDDVTIRVGGRALAIRQPPIAPIDALLSPYTGRHAPGILGSVFFTDAVVTLDFDHHAVIVRDSLDRAELAGAVSIPLTIEGGIPYVRATLRFAGHPSADAKLLVDLGAKSTLLLAEPFIARAGLGDLQAAGVRSPLGAGVGGETRYSFVRLDALEIGPDPRTHLDSIVVGLSIGGSIRQRAFDGLLGAEFLRRYRVTFDYRGRRLYLRPRQPPVPRLDFDMSGIFAKASGPTLHTFTVADVAPASAAERAGIRVGEQIVSVAGRDAAAMTLDDLRIVLRGPEHARVQLGLLRAGKRIDVEITLAKRV